MFSHVNVFALNLQNNKIIQLMEEIWRSPVEVGKLPPLFTHGSFLFIPGGDRRISEPSTVSLAYSIYSSSDKNQDFMNQCRSPLVRVYFVNNSRVDYSSNNL